MSTHDGLLFSKKGVFVFGIGGRLVNLADSVREIVAFAVVRHERQKFFHCFFPPQGKLGQPCTFAVAFLMSPRGINCLKRVLHLHLFTHA